MGHSDLKPVRAVPSLTDNTQRDSGETTHGNESWVEHYTPGGKPRHLFKRRLLTKMVLTSKHKCCPPNAGTDLNVESRENCISSNR